MKPFFLFLIASGILGLAPTGFAGDYESCNAYGEVNERLGCDADNYLIRFGQHYCREFVERNEDFDPETRVVLKSIRDCLIRDIQTDAELSCENTETRAIESHHQCYVSSGFCELPFLEQMKIWWVVKSETARTSFGMAMSMIGDSCRRRN